MKIIVCIDDNGGMLFNKRRQSRDVCVTDKISEISAGKILWMNEYSKALFSDSECSFINVSDTFLNQAGKGEWCFVETEPLSRYENLIEELVVFRWNRVYPADLQLDIALEKFKMIKSEEFEGNSHKKITMEVYVP